MQHCHQPFVRYLPGEVQEVNPMTGKVERSAVACGNCAACLANRKQDWAGRLVGEALYAASVAFVTLTYKEEPDHFRYRDIQLMLKAFRIALWRRDRTSVRFFAVGEYGEKKGRRHWHLLLFFDKPTKLRRMRKRELWHFWPHGWANLENVKGEDIVARVRYVAKYVCKAIDDPRDMVHHQSLKPGIGDAFFRDLAIKTATAGLVPKGKYQHNGITWQQGRKAGQHVDFTLTGASRRNFIRYWRDAWAVQQPGKDIPVNQWLSAFDPDFIMPREGGAKLGPLEGEPRFVVKRQVGGGSAGIMMITTARGDVHCLTVDKQGYASVEIGGLSVFVGQSITEAISISGDAVEKIDNWLRYKRGRLNLGPPKNEQAQEQVVASKQRRKDAIREHCKQSRERLRAKHGVASAAHSIYAAGFDISGASASVVVDPIDSETGEVLSARVNVYCPEPGSFDSETASPVRPPEIDESDPCKVRRGFGTPAERRAQIAANRASTVNPYRKAFS